MVSEGAWKSIGAKSVFRESRIKVSWTFGVFGCKPLFGIDAFLGASCETRIEDFEWVDLPESQTLVLTWYKKTRSRKLYSRASFWWVQFSDPRSLLCFVPTIARKVRVSTTERMSTNIRVEDKSEGGGSFRSWKHMLKMVLDENDLLDHVPKPEEEDQKVKGQPWKVRSKTGMKFLCMHESE